MRRFLTALFAVAAIAAMFAFPAGTARAATLTWDTAPGTVGVGDSGITGGNGTWDTTNGNWTSDGGGNNVAWVNANNDTAVFGDTAGTVTLGMGITVGGLTFNDVPGYTVTGDTLTFGAAGSIAANEDATIDSVIAGGAAITKTGAGTLTLTGANTYTGLTTVSAGVLRLEGAAFATAPRDYYIASNAVLNLHDPDNVPVGTSTINGTGTLRITGGFWCEGGGRYITMALGSGGLIDVPTGSELDNGGWWTATWTSNLADLNVDGRFNIWDGHDVFVDALTGAGTVLRGHGKLPPPSDGPVSTLTVGVDNGSGTFSGTIIVGHYSMPLEVVKTGSGTQTLTGTSNYLGTMLVSAGTMALSGEGSVNEIDGITVDGPTAVFMQNSSVANDRTFTLTEGTLGGTGTITTAITSGPDVTIAPGDRTLATAEAGMLTIANAVDLTDGTTEMRLFSPTSSDTLLQSTTGGLTYGGILKVIDLNPTDFAIGNHWDLFEFDSQSGTFSNDSEFGTLGGINLPLLSFGQKWSFDYGTGVLSVVLGVIPGDTNNDGVVDAVDYITLKKNFGTSTGAGLAAGDFNSSGTVNWADLNILTSNIGPGSGAPGTAPEPCSAILLVLGALAVIRRRRKA